MLESIIKNYDELPLFLNAKNLSKVLGLSESSIYELMHEKDFPSLCTTPTRVHQRLSQNNLRKRQISCETTAELSK